MQFLNYHLHVTFKVRLMAFQRIILWEGFNHFLYSNFTEICITKLVKIHLSLCSFFSYISTPICDWMLLIATFLVLSNRKTVCFFIYICHWNIEIMLYFFEACYVKKNIHFDLFQFGLTGAQQLIKTLSKIGMYCSGF